MSVADKTQTNAVESTEIAEISQAVPTQLALRKRIEEALNRLQGRPRSRDLDFAFRVLCECRQLLDSGPVVGQVHSC